MNQKTPFGDSETFTLNIDKCIEDKSIPAVIKGLFYDLRAHGYISVGKFFSEMSDDDLEVLSVLTDRTTGYTASAEVIPEDVVNKATEHLALLGMGLVVGDGRELTMDNADDGFKLAITYIAIEGLHRMGMVEAVHENWSMDKTDTGVIVKPLEK